MNFEKNVMVKKYNDGVIEEVEDVILREFLLDIKRIYRTCYGISYNRKYCKARRYTKCRY